MGYTTDFDGHFVINPPLTSAQAAYINRFSDTRRMKRDASLTANRPDPMREAVGLPVGSHGEFFVGAGGSCGQEQANDILDSNSPPDNQPGLWCQWVVGCDNATLEWNGAEKFYHYAQWLQYMIDNFFEPWGCDLVGEVTYQGEESDDFGKIRVYNGHIVQTARGAQTIGEYENA
jgi:hypothetical protein